MFYNASSTGALNHIQSHTRWTHTDPSTAQYYKIHGAAVCAANASGAAGERASGSGTSDRTHVRVRTTWDSDATYGTTAFATPHEEDYHLLLPPSCIGKHSVRAPHGYVDAAGEVYNEMVTLGGHAYGGIHYWGGTGTVVQCDGNTPVNHGFVYYIRGN